MFGIFTYSFPGLSYFLGVPLFQAISARAPKIIETIMVPLSRDGIARCVDYLIKPYVLCILGCFFFAKLSWDPLEKH